MSQLVQVGARKSESLGKSDRLPAVQVVFVESDTADIFHRSVVMLRHEHLVILPERVGFAEHIFVKVHATHCDEEHLIKIHIVDD